MSTGIRIDAALASGWFGAGLPETTRTRLVELAELTSMPAGAIALREGSPVDSLGVVVDGRLAIRLAVPGRGAVTVLTVEPGDCIGWSALVPPFRATSTVVAIEPTTLVSFDGPALRARDRCRSGACCGRPAARAGRRVTAARLRPGRSCSTSSPGRTRNHGDPDAGGRPAGRRPAGCRSTTSTVSSTRCRADGRTIIGPVVRDEAIILDEITSADDLPAGRGAETAPGRYRLTRRDDAQAVRPRRRADVPEALDVPTACTHPRRQADSVRCPIHRFGSRILPRSRSSASGPVSWPPSASRIASCSTARRSTATIAPAAPRPSSSPSNARRRPRPASARPWARGPR